MPGIGKLQSFCFLHIVFQLDPLLAFGKGQVFIVILLFSEFFQDTENYREITHFQFPVSLNTSLFRHAKKNLHTQPYVSQSLCSTIKLSYFSLHAKGLQNLQSLYMHCGNNIIATKASLQLHL